jgi:hypothetical protein
MRATVMKSSEAFPGQLEPDGSRAHG